MRRTGQGSAPPLDIVSRDFLRNVAPQLTKLVLQNASRGTLQDACLMLRKLRDLDLTHWNCCQYHQLLDISSSVAAQLTRLQIDCQASVQGSIHDGSEPLLLVKFQFLIELTAFEKQVRAFLHREDLLNVPGVSAPPRNQFQNASKVLASSSLRSIECCWLSL